MIYEELVGGVGGGYILSMSGVYDPTKYIEVDKSNILWSSNTDTWTQLISGATGRFRHSAITYNNGTDQIMVIFGGHNGSYLNDTWEYNITTDTWTQLISGATARCNHSAITYNNGTDQIMVIFGGNNSSGELNDTWEYNITTDTWRQLSSGATARCDHSAITYNNGTDQIMVIFGSYNMGNRLNDTWEYNITTDTWTQLSSGATSRNLHSAITYNNGTDDIMVIFGGNNSSGELNDTWEYNITTDTWRQLSSGATARYAHTAITYHNGTDQIIVIFGGTRSYLNDVWEYKLFTEIKNAKLLLPIKE